MSVATNQHRGRRTLWHPVVGAVGLGVLGPALLIAATFADGAHLTPAAVGVSAFLVMGAIAGFAVSGST